MAAAGRAEKVAKNRSAAGRADGAGAPPALGASASSAAAAAASSSSSSLPSERDADLEAGALPPTTPARPPFFF